MMCLRTGSQKVDIKNYMNIFIKSLPAFCGVPTNLNMIKYQKQCFSTFEVSFLDII